MNEHDTLTLIRQIAALRAFGVTDDDILDLHYRATRLHNWYERLCNDTEVDDNDKAWCVIPNTGARYKVPNLGNIHEPAIEALAKKYPQAQFVINCDPRGCPIKFGEDERGIVMSGIPSREVKDALFFHTTKEF